MTVSTNYAATNGGTQTMPPRYVTEELATAESVALWLNKMSAQNYRLISIIPIEQTNHFNKEVASVVWIVMEYQGPPA
jgi:hypothetical protein